MITVNGVRNSWLTEATKSLRSNASSSEARWARARALGAGAATWAALCAVMTAALVVHPSSRGLHTVFELWGVAVLAATITEGLRVGLADLLVGALAAVAGVVVLTAGHFFFTTV